MTRRPARMLAAALAIGLPALVSAQPPTDRGGNWGDAPRGDWRGEDGARERDAPRPPEASLPNGERNGIGFADPAPPRDDRRFDRDGFPDRGSSRSDHGGGYGYGYGAGYGSRYGYEGAGRRNHAWYQAPRYVAPRDWTRGYRRYALGGQLPGAFYGSRYWLSEPWSYRLPAASGRSRWIRYYDDVLLVDTRSGRIVDARQDFFSR